MTAAKTFLSHPLTSFLSTCLIAGSVLAILGPYGTARFDFVIRALFWIGLCMAGGVGALAADLLLKRRNNSSSLWTVAIAQSIGATITVFICFLGLQVLTVGWPNRGFYLIIPFYIWVISILISGIGALATARTTSPDRDAGPALLTRIKPKLRRSEIYALSAEDHYVRVVTADGDDLILMRLSDAIKETAPLTGLQVHRSWWVAEAGIEKVNNQNGKFSIELKNGTTAPVSRANHKSVRDAGWS